MHNLALDAPHFGDRIFDVPGLECSGIVGLAAAADVEAGAVQDHPVFHNLGYGRFKFAQIAVLVKQ